MRFQANPNDQHGRRCRQPKEGGPPPCLDGPPLFQCPDHRWHDRLLVAFLALILILGTGVMIDDLTAVPMMAWPGD